MSVMMSFIKDMSADYVLETMSLMPQKNVSLNQNDDVLIESAFSSTSQNVLYKELRRIEKLVIAIFLITNHLKDIDILKKNVRNTVLELLDIGHVPYDYDSRELILRINYMMSHIDSLMSFITVAKNIEYVSDINASLLTRELLALHTHLSGRVENIKENIFSTDKKIQENNVDLSNIFDKDVPSISHNSASSSNTSNIQEKKKNSYNKDPGITNVTKNNNINNSNRHSSIKDISKGQESYKDVLKNDRKGQIMEIIKDIGEVTIKDIASRIIKCSEKTLQRDLQDLMNNKVITKIGTKRWSKYKIVE